MNTSKNNSILATIILAVSIVGFVITPGIITIETAYGADPIQCTAADKADKNNPCSNGSPSYTLLEPLPCISSTDANGNPVTNSGCTSSGNQIATKKTVNFSDYIQYLFNLIIAISAVAAVLVLVWGGFKYVTTDSFGGKEEGRQVITQALQGLLLVLCSYLILRTIDPRLVAIPTTLVAPLNIRSDMRDSTTNFLSTLSTVAASRVQQDMANLKGNTTALRQANNSIAEQMKTLQSERSALISQVKEITGATTDDQVLQKCTSGFPDTWTDELCNKILLSVNNERSLTGIYTTNVATGKMNIAIQNSDALGGTTNLTKQNLLEQIDADKAVYSKLLIESSQAQLVPQLEDYAAYSKSMVNIYSSIAENSKSNPAVITSLNIAQDTIVAASTITGAATGSVVGGAIGYAAGSAIGNSVIGGLKSNMSQADANKSISDIQTEVNSVVANKKIKNPAALSAYKDQAYALIKSLGGKGDGTDKIIEPSPNVNDTPMWN